LGPCDGASNASAAGFWYATASNLVMTVFVVHVQIAAPVFLTADLFISFVV
jgi:hypothetical protein